MTLSKVIRDQEGVPTSQNASPTTNMFWNGQKITQPKSSQKKRPELAKKHQAKITPENSTFRSARQSDSCYIGKQPLYFRQMTLSKVDRAHKRVHSSQNDSPTTNMSWIDRKKHIHNHPQNSTFRSVTRSHSCHTGNEPLYLLKWP